MDQIKARTDQGVKQAVVVGAGFIGLELVENLVRRGIATTVVELQDQVLPPLDKEMTTPILETLTAKGVTVLLCQSAVGFEQTPDGLLVRLNTGEQLPAQLVIIGVGVRPENKLAVEAGLEVGPRGGIRVNDHLLTSDPDIYAVGDAIEVTDFVSGEPARFRWPARRIGRAASPPTTSSAVAPLSRHAGNGNCGRLRTFGCPDRGIGESPAAGQAAFPQDLHPSGPSCRVLSRRGGDGAEAALPPGDGPNPRRPGGGRRGRR